MKQTGLTLIEVLIALAIVSIAMTAIIKVTSQNIRSTAYLQKKTTAMWVAQEVINEAHANLLDLADSKGNQRLTTEMLGQDWYWQMAEEKTPNEQVKKILVRVYESGETEKDKTPVVTLESYSYHEK